MGTEQIVVIGAGLAAVSAIETLRDEGYTGGLTLVGKEPDLPYERPQLSKEFLAGDKEFQLSHDEAWYAEKDVTVLTGTTATAIERCTGSGQTVSVPVPARRAHAARSAPRASWTPARSARSDRTPRALGCTWTRRWGR